MKTRRRKWRCQCRRETNNWLCSQLAERFVEIDGQRIWVCKTHFQEHKEGTLSIVQGDCTFSLLFKHGEKLVTTQEIA